MKKNKNEQQENTLPIGSEPRLTKPDLQARIQDHLALLLADEGYRSRLHAEARIPLADHAGLLREYLRFAYLAWIMPEGATPSKAVDEAWHTHILFTRSYHAFCAAAGGAYLHHQPGTGPADEAGFREAYHRTLDRYRAEFGEPPARWWPDDRPKAIPPAERPARRDRYERAAGRVFSALLLLAIPVAILGALSRFMVGAPASLTWIFMGIGTVLGLPFALMALAGAGEAAGGDRRGGGGSSGSCGGFSACTASCSSGCGGGGCGS